MIHPDSITQMMYSLAYNFRMLPSEMMSMSISELRYWYDGIGWISEQIKREQDG